MLPKESTCFLFHLLRLRLRLSRLSGRLLARCLRRRERLPCLGQGGLRLLRTPQFFRRRRRCRLPRRRQLSPRRLRRLHARLKSTNTVACGRRLGHLGVSRRLGRPTQRASLRSLALGRRARRRERLAELGGRLFGLGARALGRRAQGPLAMQLGRLLRHFDHQHLHTCARGLGRHRRSSFLNQWCDRHRLQCLGISRRAQTSVLKLHRRLLGLCRLQRRFEARELLVLLTHPLERLELRAVELLDQRTDALLTRLKGSALLRTQDVERWLARSDRNWCCRARCRRRLVVKIELDRTSIGLVR